MIDITPASEVTLPVTNRLPPGDRAAARRVSQARAGDTLARLGLTAALIAGLTLALWRPLTPWWLHADPDATYLGSALNLLAGYPNEHRDHPGVPLHAVLVLTLGVDHAWTWLTDGTPPSDYVNALLVEPGPATWMLRAWAIAFFLFGVAAAYEVGRRTVRGAWAGPAAVAMYLACPGHLAMADTFRPVNLLSALCLVIVSLLTHALGRARPCDEAGKSDPPLNLLLGALALFGAAVSLKIHALGLAAAVAATCLMLRREDWIASARSCTSSLLKWRALPAVIVLALAACVMTNVRRDVSSIDPRAIAAVAALLVWGGASILVNRSRDASGAAAGRVQRLLLHPMPPLAAVAVLVGLLAPFAVFVDECVPTLRTMWWSLTGQWMNRPVALHEIPPAVLRLWQDPRLWLTLPLMAIAAVGLLAGGRARSRDTAIWLLAAGGMFALAMARTAAHGSPHHYAAPIALLIPAALVGIDQLCRLLSAGVERRLGQAGRMPAALAVGTLSGLVAVPTLVPVIRGQNEAWVNAARCAAIADIEEHLSTTLGENEYVMCDFWARGADAAHFTQIRDYCFHTPDRRYRTLPDTPTAGEYAREHDLTPAYYLTFGERLTQVEQTHDGRYHAHNAWGNRWAVEPMPLPVSTDLPLRLYRIAGRVTGDS